MSDFSINVYRDGRTGGLQLSIDDANGGYRLCGPKFNGSSKLVLSFKLDDRSDIAAIRQYLDRAEAALSLPLPEPPQEKADE